MTAYRIRHVNTYSYQNAVVSSHHRLRLTPHTGFNQQLRQHVVDFSLTDYSYHSALDSFSNAESHVEMHIPYTKLVITAFSEVVVNRRLPAWQQDQLLWDQAMTYAPNVEQFRYNSPHVERAAEITAYAQASFQPGRRLLEAYREFIMRMHDDFIYDPVATDISTPVREVLCDKKGVCQDFAHLAIAALRGLGLAACYVSGYLETMPPAGQKRLVGADASHAWLAIWHPQLGWVQADPTNGCLVADRHVVLAVGRDFSDVSPITGIIFGGGKQQLKIAVDVVPEVEWPHAQWVMQGLPLTQQQQQ